jgi:hypothetical protein
VRSAVGENAKSFAGSGDDEPRGNPNLEYESRLIKSWEPSGVPLIMIRM